MSSFGPVAPYYDLLMAAVPYRMWVEYVKLLLEMQDYQPTQWLDVACGTGTCAEMLAMDGHQVTGFDLSPSMIERAKSKLSGRPFSIDYHVADAREFDLGTKFQAAYCLFDSLNYINDLDGFRAAIAQVAKHLQPGGAFVFDLNTAYAFEQELFTQQDLRKRTTLQYDWVGNYVPETRQIRVEMDFWYEGEQFHETHLQRAHSPEEVIQALKDAGFVRHQAYHSYTLKKPRKNSDRIHYVAWIPS
ncbi:MAG: methyltransferase domain-containing protein [Armatimonadetes bacterium]|nr:methyltransferase domain-containing protein [Armatimonadota bacterium]